LSSLKSNLARRVERLPKPTSVAGAMQPLFEAISNAIHSTQAKFGESVVKDGRVVVTMALVQIAEAGHTRGKLSRES